MKSGYKWRCKECGNPQKIGEPSFLCLTCNRIKQGRSIYEDEIPPDEIEGYKLSKRKRNEQ